MSRSGADLALLLLEGFRSLADAGSAELAERGYPRIRPIHDFTLRSIVAGADTTAELARELGISKQAVSKTVAVLESEGYVATGTDARDGRRRVYSVTDRGHALLRTGLQVFDELRGRWAERIGAEQLERLEDALADLGIRTPTHHDAPGWLSGSALE
ncbi:MarR family winged helix-turn-helix transcriptional regulator [uncultured Cellulomonas sp.]|uniref:MarR family winged helix-turn-helix transcriptional regulator n=1 Tax=uncultured Cellulomonas sp. TaxID=189682 RepID=UPI0028F13E2A|nr:MarR family winged helix-turn-helix transcriptional regulator [uncultured Cellulomonas sp.]